MKFIVVCWADLHAGKWLVVRTNDLRVMTEGNVFTCLRWVDVRAPVQGDKRGRELAKAGKERLNANLLR